MRDQPLEELIISTIENKEEVARLGLVYHSIPGVEHRPRMSSPEEIYHHALSLWDMNTIDLQEQFRIFLLDAKLRVLGSCLIAVGTTTAVYPDFKLILGAVILTRATSLIVLHNHPSMDVKPSNADIKMTMELRKVCDVLDVKLYDHLIISRKTFYSMHDQGDL